MKTMKFIQIENRTGKVSLADVVTPDSIDRLISELETLYGAKAVMENQKIGEIICQSADALESVDIHIHSPGGSVMDGARLYYAIHEMRARGVHVTATINTLAASMGSVIAMAADRVQIVNIGRMMIHEASQSISGNADDHARAAKNLDEISGEIAQLYADKTGGTQAEMRELMRRETWMGAEDAVAMGFADEIVKFLPDAKPGLTPQKGQDMKLFYSNAAAKEEIGRLEGEIANLKTEGEAATGQVTALTADLATASASLTAMTAERDDAVSAYETSEKASALVVADLATANAKLSTFDDAVESAAQAKFAGLGGPPIAENSSDEGNDDLSGLTGLAKVTAIFKAQNASKTPIKSK